MAATVSGMRLVVTEFEFFVLRGAPRLNCTIRYETHLFNIIPSIDLNDLDSLLPNSTLLLSREYIYSGVRVIELIELTEFLKLRCFGDITCFVSSEETRIPKPYLKPCSRFPNFL